MSTAKDALVHVSALQNGCVVCIGDVMLDRFVYGSVDRISPEAPVPVMRVSHEREMLGGAGNVASNLAALTARFELYGVIGADTAGERVQSLVNELGDTTSALFTEIARPTTIKTRCIGGTQQMLRFDLETTAPVSPEVADAIVRRVSNAIQTECCVVLSDYGKGVLTRDLISRVLSVAKRSGRTVVVDPKGRDYSRYQGADIITPNRSELGQATGMPVADDAGVIAAAQSLIKQFGFRAVVAKRSEQGMTIVQATGEVDHLRAEAREVFDVSGAGDTVTATLAAGISVGLALRDAAYLANLAAGVAVGKIGTTPTTIEELRRAVRTMHLEQGDSKIVSTDAAERVVRQWQQAGLKVGFTNGCYDLLHPGHVRLLSESRKGCDRLVIGLNSDASVRRLKGPTRPVQDEASRSTVLAALSSVDLLVVFDEDTPLAIIQRLRPDVLIKGADYTVATVVGADFVQSYGGEVRLIDLVPNQSTTRLVARMTSEPSNTPAADDVSVGILSAEQSVTNSRGNADSDIQMPDNEPGRTQTRRSAA